MILDDESQSDDEKSTPSFQRRRLLLTLRRVHPEPLESIVYTVAEVGTPCLILSSSKASPLSSSATRDPPPPPAADALISMISRMSADDGDSAGAADDAGRFRRDKGLAHRCLGCVAGYSRRRRSCKGRRIRLRRRNRLLVSFIVVERQNDSEGICTRKNLERIF